MAHMTRNPQRTAFARALALALAPALLQPLAVRAQADPATLAPVVITGKSPPTASVAGWGNAPLAGAPLQATTIDAAQIRDAGARRLADLTRFDPSVTSAYNT